MSRFTRGIVNKVVVLCSFCVALGMSGCSVSYEPTAINVVDLPVCVAINANCRSDPYTRNHRYHNREAFDQMLRMEQRAEIIRDELETLDRKR